MKPQTTIFNTQALVSVRVYDKEHQWRWTWKDSKKLLWGSTKAGFHYHTSLLHSGVWSLDQIRTIEGVADYLFQDNKLYFKPYVQLKFTNGETHIKNFETLAEAFKWAREQVKIGINIKLEF